MKITPRRLIGLLCAVALLCCAAMPASAGWASNGTLGQVNPAGGGTLSTTDARMILQKAAGKITFGDQQSSLADVDGDGSITTTDARLVLQKTAGKLAFFPLATAGEHPTWTLWGAQNTSAEAEGPLSVTKAGAITYGPLNFGNGDSSILQLELDVESADGEEMDVCLDSPDGDILGTVTLQKGAAAENLYLFDVEGSHTLVLNVPEGVSFSLIRLTYTYDWLSVDDDRPEAFAGAGFGLKLDLSALKDTATPDTAAVAKLLKDVGAGYVILPLESDAFDTLSDALSEDILVVPSYTLPAMEDGADRDAYLESLRETLAMYILNGSMSILEVNADGTDLTDKEESGLYNFCRTLDPALLISAPRSGDAHFGDYTRVIGRVGEGTFQSQYKAAELTFTDLLKSLCSVWAAGGSLSLELPLTAEGKLPEDQGALAGMGGWMEQNGDSLKTATGLSFPYDFTENVFYTVNENTLYVFLGTWPADGQLLIPALTVPVTGAHLIGDNTALTVVTANGGVAVTLPKEAPATPVPVVALTTEGTPAPAAVVPYSEDLITAAASVTASENSESAKNLIDEIKTNTWSGKADSYVEVSFGKPTLFNLVQGVESISRVTDVSVEVPDGDGWKTVGTASALSSERFILCTPTLTDKVRLHIKALSADTAVLKGLSVYAGMNCGVVTTITTWEGYEQVNFTVNGLSGYFVRPAVPAEGNPWVWRARFFAAYDAVDRELLRRGWSIACFDQDGAELELYGSPLSMQRMEAFHDVMWKDFGMSQYTVLFGFSRGGTYSVNFAHTYPDRVGCLYLDAPLTDLTQLGNNTVKNLYGYSIDEMKANKMMPNDYAADIAKSGIPVVTVVGLKDTAARYPVNAEVFNANFVAAGGKLLFYAKPECEHHPHSFDDAEHVNAIADFIEANRKK